MVYHNFVIPPGCKYLQIRLMAKTKNLGRTWSGSFLEVQNVKKPLWSISTYKRSQNKAETEWLEYVSPVIELPANAGPMAKVYLHMAPGAEGTVWFDDVMVKQLKSKEEALPEIGSEPKKQTAKADSSKKKN